MNKIWNNLCVGINLISGLIFEREILSLSTTHAKRLLTSHIRGDKKLNSQSRNTGFDVALILKLLKIDYHTYSRGVLRPAAAAAGTPTRIKGNCEKMPRMARERHKLHLTSILPVARCGKIVADNSVRKRRISRAAA